MSTALTTPEQIDAYRMSCLISAIKLYLKTGMLVNRGVTPARMRELASSYTRSTYARSRKGMEQALDHLQQLKDYDLPVE